MPRVSSHTARFTPREFYSVTRSTFRDGLRRCAIDGGSRRLEVWGEHRSSLAAPKQSMQLLGSARERSPKHSRRKIGNCIRLTRRYPPASIPDCVASSVPLTAGASLGNTNEQVTG